MIERALGGELTHHLGYPPGGAKPDAVLEEVTAWQTRALDPSIRVFFDALRVKIRDEATVRNKAVYF